MVAELLVLEDQLRWSDFDRKEGLGEVKRVEEREVVGRLGSEKRGGGGVLGLEGRFWGVGTQVDGEDRKGIWITYKSNGDIGVNQSKYVKDLLHKAGMDSCKPASTPCKPHTPLLLNEGDPLSDPTLYRSIVGSLQYLTFTRPDIAYAVNTVCQFMAKPTEVHFGAVKRILRFLKGTMHHGITFSAHTEVGIHAFSDADWAADLNTRRSVTGYVVYIGCNPVSWQSKKQDSVSRSSTEAEYKALAHTAADIAWIRSVLKDMAVIFNYAPVIYCDNKSAIAIVQIQYFIPGLST
nr:uncharacterized protein LOC108170699 [Malus domestica]